MVAKTILIPPGHGGRDPGAVAPTGQTEANTNLNVSRYLKTALIRCGFSVILTRDNNVDCDVAAQQAQIKKYHPDLVVSIHHNGNIPGAQGAEVCAQVPNANAKYDEQCVKLADLVLDELEAWGQTVHGPGIIRRKSSNGVDFYGVLRTAAQMGIPAVIVEAAFMSAADVKEIDTLTEQKAEAEAIAKAVCKYYGVAYKG